MALFTRLNTLSRCLKFDFTWNASFHSVSRPKAPLSKPPGARSFFFKIFMKPSQSQLKKADDIPDTFDLIYRNTMSKYILGAQIVSLVTGSVVFLTYILKSDYKTYRKSLEWSASARPSENEELFYLTFFIIFIVLLQTMVTKFPLRIYKVPKTNRYIGVNYGNFFLKEKYKFHRGEIHHVEEKGILPWKENRYLIQSKNNRRSLILLDQFFRRPADLNIMLGEQKDPDLEETSNT